MSDPELTARAQRAAERLEQSWDRWRRLHGLATEQAQPVSSYVGYSLAEPWGRPRVIFGMGAEEAERLAALLEQDESADPRFSQGLLWESEPGPQHGNGVHEASFAALPAPVPDRARPVWNSEPDVQHGHGAHSARPPSPVADRAGPRWEAGWSQHGNGVAGGTSFSGLSVPGAGRTGPQAAGRTGSAAVAGIAEPGGSSAQAGSAGDFETPNRGSAPGW